jgi:hypothetical protein
MNGRTSTFFSSAFVPTLAALLIVACGGGGGDSYGPDGVVAEPLRALPAPASATTCRFSEFVSYEHGATGPGYRCLTTAESAQEMPA